MVGPGRAAGGVPRRPRLPLRQLREEGVHHAGEAARQGAAGLADRLVNVASSVYGKVYFPVRSNGLKPLGRFLGAAWTDPQASGLQSLVWRHRWEATRDERFRQSLLQYNREDCEAVRLLVDRLDQIRRDARVGPDHRVRQPAEAARDRNREGGPRAVRADPEVRTGRTPQREGIRIRERDAGRRMPPKKRGRERSPGLPPDHSAKASRTVLVRTQAEVPKGARVDLVPTTAEPAERTVIDLVFTRSGCRKTVTRYVGIKSRCPKCGQHYNPPPLAGIRTSLRACASRPGRSTSGVVLRLPYEIIAQVMDHLFGIGLEHDHPCQLPGEPRRVLCPDRGGHTPGDPEERLRPRR